LGYTSFAREPEWFTLAPVGAIRKLLTRLHWRPTDVDPVNAIFGRLLKTPDGHIVTLAYWQQKTAESHEDIPYFLEK